MIRLSEKPEESNDSATVSSYSSTDTPSESTTTKEASLDSTEPLQASSLEKKIEDVKKIAGEKGAWMVVVTSIVIIGLAIGGFVAWYFSKGKKQSTKKREDIG